MVNRSLSDSQTNKDIEIRDTLGRDLSRTLSDLDSLMDKIEHKGERAVSNEKLDRTKTDRDEIRTRYDEVCTGALMVHVALLCAGHRHETDPCRRPTGVRSRTCGKRLRQLRASCISVCAYGPCHQHAAHMSSCIHPALQSCTGIRCGALTHSVCGLLHGRPTHSRAQYVMLAVVLCPSSFLSRACVATVHSLAMSWIAPRAARP